MPTPQERRADFVKNGFRCIDSTSFMTNSGVEVVVQTDSFRSLTDPDRSNPRTRRQGGTPKAMKVNRCGTLRGFAKGVVMWGRLTAEM